MVSRKKSDFLPMTFSLFCCLLVTLLSNCAVDEPTRPVSTSPTRLEDMFSEPARKNGNVIVAYNRTVFTNEQWASALIAGFHLASEIADENETLVVAIHEERGGTSRNNAYFVKKYLYNSFINKEMDSETFLGSVQVEEIR